MKISNKTKFELFILLIVLNVILRYAVVPHELFPDSFEMHILANSLSEFGEARWWVHPLSIIGMYPNSYASAISFILSGVSQCTGLDVELVIFIYGLIFGLFSMFAGYIVAGEIYDDDLFKFFVAFAFSTSQGILAYTTWTAHARSPFIVIFPLFLYALLHFGKQQNLRFGLITVVLSFLLLATHHLTFYLIPVFAACFLVKLVYKLKERIKFIRISENSIPFLIISAFFLMFLYPFMTHKFMSAVLSSRWDPFVFKEYLRYIGILIFLAIGGFANLVFKPNKKYEEWSLLAMLLFFTVFIYQEMYTKWFILLFAILLSGVGFMNLNRVCGVKRKYASVAIVFFLLLSICFSSYFQFLHTYQTNPSCKRYVEDNTYMTAQWIQKNMEGTGICNDRMIGWRICALSGFQFITGSYSYDQAYGFVDVSEFELVKLPYTSEDFWIDSPYDIVAGIDADEYWMQLMQTEYDSNRGSELISRFNLTNVVENTRIQGKQLSFFHRMSDSKFMQSISGEKNRIYDTGTEIIWEL